MSKGDQFADADKLTASINAKRDKYENEVPVDKPAHTNATPGEGDFHWDGNQYATDFNAGFGKYGAAVKDDRGQHPKVERITVDVGKANRGEES
jgi:hypothetical protein